MKLSIVVTFVLLSSLAASALADDACKIFNDVGDKYALGQRLMETDAQMLIATKGMTTKQHDDCFSNSDDCFFTYKDGIEYVISRYYKDDTLTTIAHEVVQVARANGSYAGPLIAGIHWGDAVETVRKKLGTLPQNFPEWTFTDRRYEAGEGSKFLFSTGPVFEAQTARSGAIRYPSIGSDILLMLKFGPKIIDLQLNRLGLSRRKGLW